jgi:hypothetical protein
MTFWKRRQTFFYRQKPRPRWQVGVVYVSLGLVLAALLFVVLRDTTPVRFVKPSDNDMHLDRGDTVNSDKILDVYWRVSIRHVSSVLSAVCRKDNYNILTHKNVMMDNVRMKESYIYLCTPVGTVQSVVNARAVVSAAAVKTVRCVETYGNTSKTIVRKYPFSLKYVCGETFITKTRIVREAKEACTWLHAIDIVESVWD